MTSETPHSYEFGNFRLDTKEKVLFCDNQRISLRPKVFDTLQVFVEHAGRLLEKDELMQRIWQDHFVEESNLAFNIKMLRQILNDNAQHPRFIETVPRRGYRFIADVRKSVDTAATASNIEQLKTAAKPRAWWAAAVTVFLAGSLLILFQSTRSRLAPSALAAPILSKPFKSEKFTAPETMNAVITPDGKYVAYTRELDGKESIWLRQLETSENIQIVPPTQGRNLGLAFSHDGNSLYFVRQNPVDRGTIIYRVMTFGGIPVKVTNDTQGWISISPDDRQISFVRCYYRDDDYCSLFVADVDGKNERKLLTRPRPFLISDNQFSPDGKLIAFGAGQTESAGSDFRVILLEVASGKESEISPRTFFYIRNLKWLPEGDGLLFVADEILDGPYRIWQATVASREVKALTNDATNYGTISFDKAIDKMIATDVANTFRLYLAPMGDVHNAKSLASARTFTFAPEGRVVYAGDDGDIWMINRDGGEQRQLTNSPFKDSSPRVSPDGRYIFFCSARSGSNQVWRMNADGSNQIQLSKHEGCPRFASPDKKWVYFESGASRKLWRVSIEGSEETQVSEEEIHEPAFSPDGKLVAYFFQDKESRRKIGVRTLEGAAALKTFALSEEKSLPCCLAWEADNQTFEYAMSGSSNSIWRQSLKHNGPERVADFGSEDINDLAISPDGYLGFVRGQWIHGAVLIEGLR